MIRVLLSGGLGNQLFQYAAGRMLALKHGTGLMLDLSFVSSKLQAAALATYRRYELGVFDLPVSISDNFFRGRFLYPLAKSEYLLRKTINKQRYVYIAEDASGWDPRVMEAPDQTFLEGFFQSEKYFEAVSDALRRDLVFKEPLMGRNAELADAMQSGNSVSLHIRRGDYARLKKNLQKHGITPLDYYTKALGRIRESVSDPQLFVFSDEPDWARDNLHTGLPFTLVDVNRTPDTAWTDMQLMALCRHHIICNSTFSWWGAWLDPHPDKLVIAPEQWFADPSINARHIVPDSWIKL